MHASLAKEYLNFLLNSAMRDGISKRELEAVSSPNLLKVILRALEDKLEVAIKRRAKERKLIKLPKLRRVVALAKVRTSRGKA